MFKQIIKRNGTEEPFTSTKIKNAIQRAGRETGELLEPAEIDNIVSQVLSHLATLATDAIDVEEIQDAVELVLATSGYFDTAKAYIIYRHEHKKAREIINKAGVDTIANYLHEADWKTKENSNMSYSLQGLNSYIAQGISKTWWLNEVYTPAIAKAHQSGDMHIHDLGFVAVYCVGWDLYDLMLTGFTGVKTKISSGPAKHMRSLLGQMVNFICTLQGEAAGAQAFSHVDTFLAPFVRYDNLSYEDVKQNIQEFVYNLNIPTRVGFQAAFSNITMDLTVPDFMKDDHVVIGGITQIETYGDFQEEMNMINKAFLEVMAEGDNDGNVFTFPIPTYNITKEFDWDNPIVDKLMEVTGKYGIPYFSNFVNSSMNPEDSRSMCCRLRIDNQQLTYKGGGLFGANPLTGSLGVVTVNMPRIGYMSNNIHEFKARLKEVMDLASESLMIKRSVVEHYTDTGLYPYSKFYMRAIKGQTGAYWSNHFNTIGLVGMNEAVMNLMGEDITTEKGQQVANEILDFMLARLDYYMETTGINYNLEATPAESTSYRLARKDIDQYPDIITARYYTGGNEDFYTNSTHPPVNFSENMFDVLDVQDDIQQKYTGGTVVHLYTGERLNDITTVKNLIRYIAENYHLPYYSITPTFSVCPDHGYISGEHFKCPTCGKDTNVYSRVVGYLRPVSEWNKGKQDEFNHRSKLNAAKKVNV